ncbi:MAG: YkgJ family cysteine cluster protein, partial [Opitutaceae bacterium]|nr:YkgJ family cysteine cluster protein [Cytophagales bacterium]
DIAFVLLLETGLAESGDKQTLIQWRKMGTVLPEELEASIGQEWVDFLMLPEIQSEDPIFFAQRHIELIQSKAQEQFGLLQTHHQLHEASVLMMGVALHLARGIGASPKDMADLWVETAKKHGALE